MRAAIDIINPSTAAPRNQRSGGETRSGPTADQVATMKAVTRWYLRWHHGTPDDPGVAAMFCDPAKVGAFAVEAAALRAGDAEALFRLLVATVMFQRRQDVQILRVLRGISRREAEELTDLSQLVSMSQTCGCPAAKTTEGLAAHCDLSKDPVTKVGRCATSPEVACAPKRHTVLLKRYGHFGKVPTSAALAIREAGAPDLAALRAHALAVAADSAAAALCLELALRRAWRISDKIAAMYLSMLSNPDLSPGLAPWTDGVDWTGWVVVDSNVDLFLARLGYRGRGTYAARRAFLIGLAAEIDLSELKPGLAPFNPRLVQQAAYLFMSATNRRSMPGDCSTTSAECDRCDDRVARICVMRRH